MQQNEIHDDYNELNLKPGCRKGRVSHYSSYDIDIINLGHPLPLGNNKCDLAGNDWTGSCNGDLTVTFTSRLTRLYTSQHGKNWITILTEEGGVVGFVTFLTWFLGIFSI